MPWLCFLQLIDKRFHERDNGSKNGVGVPARRALRGGADLQEVMEVEGWSLVVLGFQGWGVGSGLRVQDSGSRVQG